MQRSGYDDNIEALPTLAALPELLDSAPLGEKEKHNAHSASLSDRDSADEKEKAVGSDSVLSASLADDDDDKPVYRKGEPVITTGRDVSRFAVDLRDDGDQALTFRSIVLGTMFAAMGAALSQVGLYSCQSVS